MAKGKVKSAVFKKSGTGQYGEYHIFDVVIEGDDKVLFGNNLLSLHRSLDNHA